MTCQKLALAFLTLLLAGCSSDSDRYLSNLSRDVKEEKLRNENDSWYLSSLNRRVQDLENAVESMKREQGCCDQSDAKSRDEWLRTQIADMKAERREICEAKAAACGTCDVCDACGGDEKCRCTGRN